MGELPQVPVKTKPVGLLVALGLILPGLGHVVAGRRGHAAIFALSLWPLIIGGLAISHMTGIDREGHPVYWLMQLGCGVPTWVVWFGGFAKEPLIGDTVGVEEQMVGMTYLAVAGILNVLALLDLVRNPRPSAPVAASSPKGKAE
jgi:hypothetical protein